MLTEWQQFSKAQRLAKQNEEITRKLEKARQKKEAKEQAKRGTADLVRRLNPKEPWVMPNWLYYGILTFCGLGSLGIIVWFVFVFL